MHFGLRIFLKRLFGLLGSLQFWILTFFCNIAVGLSAFLFYSLESRTNSGIKSFLDALWWSFSTVTTVGYGDVTPQTTAGKITGIMLMVIGTGLFATYTAIFANALLGRDFVKLGKSVSKLDHKVVDMHHDEQELSDQIEKLSKMLIRIEKRLDSFETKK